MINIIPTFGGHPCPVCNPLFQQRIKTTDLYSQLVYWFQLKVYIYSYAWVAGGGHSITYMYPYQQHGFFQQGMNESLIENFVN